MHRSHQWSFYAGNLEGLRKCRRRAENRSIKFNKLMFKLSPTWRKVEELTHFMCLLDISDQQFFSSDWCWCRSTNILSTRVIFPYYQVNTLGNQHFTVLPTTLNPTYLHHNTSSTAQGGGGSFKNRKPIIIGNADCCESQMAERIHWWTERWLELCFLEWLQWLQRSPHHNCSM